MNFISVRNMWKYFYILIAYPKLWFSLRSGSGFLALNQAHLYTGAGSNHTMGLIGSQPALVPNGHILTLVFFFFFFYFIPQLRGLRPMWAPTHAGKEHSHKRGEDSLTCGREHSHVWEEETRTLRDKRLTLARRGDLHMQKVTDLLIPGHAGDTLGSQQTRPPWQLIGAFLASRSGLGSWEWECRIL